MSTDAIVLLKDEHKQIRKVFDDFEKAGENAHVSEGKLVDTMIEVLTVHTYLENEVMYPGSASCSRTWRTTSWSPTRSTTWPTCSWSSSPR